MASVQILSWADVDKPLMQQDYIIYQEIFKKS